MPSASPFFRVLHLSRQQAAVEQIEAAIDAFHAGRFVAAITLALAAEGMEDPRPGDLWSTVVSRPDRPLPKQKEWSDRLNESRNWAKHTSTEPTRNFVGTDVGFAIVRAIDRWGIQTPKMLEFAELFKRSPKPIRPEDFDD